jgi:hypothetical protein
MSAAFWNGFPFIYSDIGTYLGSGFMPEMPIDRPITYGIFIFITSLGGLSLWLTVFIQAMMMSYVILLVLDFYLKNWVSPLVFIGIIALLTIFTGISFPVGQLMPDFSTPIMLLCLFLILAQAPLSIRARQSVFALFFLANAMHISHILLNLVLIGGLILFFFFKKKWVSFLKMKTLLQLFSFSLLGIFTMLPPISKSSYIFRMGNLAHNNILQTYLVDNCTVKNSRLCNKLSEIPTNFDYFVWDANSPLNILGWKESKAEYEEILADIYTTPKYLKMIVKASVENTCKQLQYFIVGEGNIRYPLNAPYIEPLETYCQSRSQYEHSRQYTSTTLVPYNLHGLHKFTIAISLFLLILGGIKAWIKNELAPNQCFFMVGLIVAILINAWVAATFVYPHNRAGCKVIWLLPFMVVLLIFNGVYMKRFLKQIGEQRSPHQSPILFLRFVS